MLYRIRWLIGRPVVRAAMGMGMEKWGAMPERVVTMATVWKRKRLTAFDRPRWWDALYGGGCCGER